MSLGHRVLLIFAMASMPGFGIDLLKDSQLNGWVGSLHLGDPPPWGSGHPPSLLTVQAANMQIKADLSPGLLRQQVRMISDRVWGQMLFC